MRVLETKSPDPSTMVKKKHKLRKQCKSAKDAGSESSDDCSTEQAFLQPMRRCRHVSKAVNPNGVRKTLKQISIGECIDCSRASSSSASKNFNTEDATGSTITDESTETTVWLCLQCGHQGCDRNSKEKHALRHYETPRSNSHSVVVNLTTLLIWCYDCDDEVFASDNTKLNDCFEFIKKQVSCKTETAESPAAPMLSRQSSKNDTLNDQCTEVTTKEENCRTSPRETGACAFPTGYLPKVKGLSNLGNTCFFNAVMQNLSQTPVLEHMMVKKAVTLCLPGTLCDSDQESYSGSGSENDEKHHLDPLTVALGDTGVLTQSLTTFLHDMNAAGKYQVVTPNALFGQVCRKAPRFKGFQQQDSHELLRHLLEGMKAEEIKRCQTGILKAFHLPDSIKANKVDEDKRAKIKEYGRQAKYTFIDKVFGGQFISTVLCEECHVPSQIVEPFLDISLPITEEKPQRPNNAGKKKEISTTDDTVVNDGMPSYRQYPSKHMSKKAQKKAKKEAKRKGKFKGKEKRKTHEKQEGKDDGTDDEDRDKEDDGEDEEVGQDKGSNSNQDDDVSDADVEDNLESCLDQKTTSSLDGRINGEQKPVIDTDTGHCDNTEMNCGALDGEEPEAAIQTCLGGAESQTKCSNSQGITEYIKENGVAGSRKGLDEVVESKNCDSETISEDISTLTITSRNSEDDRNESDDNMETEKSSHSVAPIIEDNIVKSKSEFWQEAALKAVNTIAPRYQPTSRECSVLSCLHQFTSAELLTGQNRFGCSHCTRQKNRDKGKKEVVYTIASKQVLIFAPPAVLTLHLKRFQQVGFSLRKVNRHVEFPLLLDLAPYCSSLCQGVPGNQGKVLYSLYGIVEHAGRLNGGHYTAYVKVRPNGSTEQIQQFIQHLDINSVKLQKLMEKLHKEKLEYMETVASESKHSDESTVGPPLGKWFYISDTRVADTSEQTVLRCQAYILFYERIH